MSGRFVFRLDELGRQDHALVGRKCANLAEMTRMGLNVPKGFALSVDAYIDFLNRTGTLEQIRRCINTSSANFKNPQEMNKLSLQIRQIVERQEMPADLRGEILEHYHELGLNCGVSQVAVSVRSAGPVSHPGQYESFLNVSGEKELISNVKKVWASTFNPRSLASRSQKGLALESDPIGVAVLKMVRAAAAGVAFTADPNTGESSRITIEANWGLGESVVSGMTSPDSYVVRKTNLEIQERNLGPKARSCIMAESGIVEVDNPSGKAGSFCLNDQDVICIAAAAKKIEEHFGMAQDIEWAIDEESTFPDKVVLLQARPEVIASIKSPLDQIVDLMLDRFSGGN